jgi:hypothetical protein
MTLAMRAMRLWPISLIRASRIHGGDPERLSSV